jgi:hypothetical protein
MVPFHYHTPQLWQTLHLLDKDILLNQSSNLILSRNERKKPAGFQRQFKIWAARLRRQAASGCAPAPVLRIKLVPGTELLPSPI